MKILFARLLAVSLLAFSASAYADTTYTSSAAYTAVIGPQTTETFDSVPLNAMHYAYFYPSFHTPTGLTISTSTGSSLFVTDPNAYYGYSYASGNYFEADYGAPDNIFTVTLPTPSKAVSFTYGGLFGSGDPFIVTLSDGFTTTLVSSHSLAGDNLLDFAGFTSSTPITSFTVETLNGPNFNAFDDISFNTPEPSSLTLLGTGLLGVFGMVRRRIHA